MDKQILNSEFDVEYFYATNWVSFFGFPVSVKYANGSIKFVPEYFAKNATDEALSGKLRSNLRGFRMEIELDWEHSFNSSSIYDALNQLVIGTRKIAAQTTTFSAGVATTALVTVGGIFAGSTTDGLKIKIGANAEVTGVATSSNETTLSAPQSWAEGAVVIMYAESSFPVRFRWKYDSTKSDIYTLVFDDANLETLIEYTINNQPINLKFKSEEIFDTIPSWYKL